MEVNYFTILWWFLPYIDMSVMGVHVLTLSQTPSHLLPPHISLWPLGHPRAPVLSTLFHALNLDCSSILHMVIYMLQWSSLKSSHPRLLPQGPKVCSLCLSCCLAHMVVITIFCYFVLTYKYTKLTQETVPMWASAKLREKCHGSPRQVRMF